MKSALISGASSGIGKEIASSMLSIGYQVTGIARDFEKCDIEDENFIPVVCDLSNKKELHRFLESYKKKDIDTLINCAGFGKFAPHEELSIKDIEKMIEVNLSAPLLLCKTFLRSIKKNNGFIFNINSISGIKPAPRGAVYGATKAGLRHFGLSLFNEARKSGIKVVNINPDITNTPFFDELDFCPSKDEQSYIDPKDIANLIQDIVQNKHSFIPTDITIEPQLFKIDKKRV